MGYGGGWGEDPNNPGITPVDTTSENYNPNADLNNPSSNMGLYIQEHGPWMTGESSNPIYLGGAGDSYDYLTSIKPDWFTGDTWAWIDYLNATNQINRGAGNFWQDNLMGTLKVGALAAGAYGLDAALAAAAASGAGAGGAAGGAAAGSGAAASGTAAGTAAGTSALDAYMASAGLAPGAFEGAAFTMPGAVAGASQLAGPTYQELGYTGLGEGMAGPTYAELGYTGLNNAEAIAAADAAAKGMSYSDILKSIDNARKVASAGNTLSKLLAGGGSSGTATKTSGINPMQLGNLLAGGTPQATDFLGQYKMNEKPFFEAQQASLGGENVYDVSGAKLANALRKK